MTQSYEATEATRVLTREEITHLTEEGGKPADTLMNVVALIATRFNTDVCSAYLLEPNRSNLVLAATLGSSCAKCPKGSVKGAAARARLGVANVAAAAAAVPSSFLRSITSSAPREGSIGRRDVRWKGSVRSHLDLKSGAGPPAPFVPVQNESGDPRFPGFAGRKRERRTKSRTIRKRSPRAVRLLPIKTGSYAQ